MILFLDTTMPPRFSYQTPELDIGTDCLTWACWFENAMGLWRFNNHATKAKELVRRHRARYTGNQP